MVRYLITFLLLSFSINAEIITTGNLLSNSGFTGGNTSWTNHGTTQQHHVGIGNECAGSAVDNSNSGCGVSGSLATLDNGGVSQTIKLSEKTNMTQAEINNGFSSTMSTDIWYWHGQDTVTMKQEVTDSSGTTSTQQRIVVGSHNNYQTYTDKITIGANTSTDYDIKVQLDIDDSANCSSHCGPDIDNVELKVAYTYINPISNESQEIINDLNEDIEDVIGDIDWEETWEELVYLEDEYAWEEEFYFEENTIWEENIYLEEELSFEEFEIENFEEIPLFESFEEVIFEEIPIEEVFFEENFTETPMDILEEVFEEEFEEEFTEFLEESGMQEEFERFLEDEGLTQEEFLDEIAEEEFNDEFTEESFEEFEEEVVENPTAEESPSETIENEEETVAETNELEEEREIASNSEPDTVQEKNESNESTEETNSEEESDSSGSEDDEVQTEEETEQDSVRSEKPKVAADGRTTADVTIAEKKLKTDLKKIAKELAQIAKETTQNLTKEDIFFKSNNTLDAYLQTDFYKDKNIYINTDTSFFNQVDLSVYTEEIYTSVTLAQYTKNDPVEVHNREMKEISIKKRELMIELEQLRSGKL